MKHILIEHIAAYPYRYHIHVMTGSEYAGDGAFCRTLAEVAEFMNARNITEYRYIGLKSTQHFRGWFGSRAARIISCDPPGYNSSNLSFFEYHKIPRPVFPLDPETEF